MAKTKWSVSRLSSYASCQYAYKLEKIDRVPRREAGWFLQGSSVHHALEMYERSGRALTVSDTQEAFLWAWGNELEAARKKQPNDSMWMKGRGKSVQNDLDSRRALGLTQVADYIREHPVDGVWAPFEIAPEEFSVEVGFEVDFGGDVVVIGYIDALEENRETGDWRVVDYKTGTKTPSDPFQMMTYAIAVKQVFGKDISSAGWWMCKDSEFVEFDQMSSFSYEDVADWYHQLSRGIGNKVFLPNPKDCFVCSVKPFCKFGSKRPLAWPPTG